MGFEFDLKDIIDIFLVALIMFQTYRLLKGTNAVNIFIGILAFLVGWFVVSFVFKMELLGTILNKIINVGAIALIVIFQNELRKFFSLIGSKKNWGIFKWISRITSSHHSSLDEAAVMQIVIACRNMARRNCGALIVIEQDAYLKDFSSTGEKVLSIINSRLIESLFYKNSPLHDGAMIIANKKIIAAGCILPVSKNRDIPKHLGLRHRSALGITERTDAIAIVVSEETGKISYSHKGSITTDIGTEELERILSHKRI